MTEQTVRPSGARVRTPPRRRRDVPPWVVNSLKLLGLLVVLVWCLFPFLWMAMTSLRTGSVAITEPNIFRGPFDFGNYEQVVELGFHFSLRNSLVVASVTTLICIAVASLACSVLARAAAGGRAGVMA